MYVTAATLACSITALGSDALVLDQPFMCSSSWIWRCGCPQRHARRHRGGDHSLREPASLFSREVPAAALVPIAGRPPAIIPDAAIVASLPRALASVGQRPERQREPVRRHLVDAKTIHRGARDYREARGTRDQSGAVQARAQRVHTDYVRHARALDARYYPAGHPRHGDPDPSSSSFSRMGA